ncbi:MAG: cofactor-independent phosphoglycerate mutase [bacterium]
MKYIIIVPDGMADYPIDGRTPLEIAHTPNMDRLAREGMIGTTRTIPDNMPAGSDVACLSLLGYDPRVYYKGRAPLEAASMGVFLKEDEVAFRCNLITVRNGIITDFSAGHIKTEEAAEIIKFIDKELGSKEIKFYPGVSYRHLLVISSSIIEDPFEITCIPPHNITGCDYLYHFPKGGGACILTGLMEESRDILRGRENGNMLWFWGGGVKMEIPKITEKFNIKGSVISAVDLVKGLGILAGLKPIDVPGATGYFDTDYLAKGKYGLKALEDNDLVFIHIEAPDEAGHNKNLEQKIKAIEEIDEKIIGFILSNLNWKARILVLSDHLTPVSLGKHTSDPTPFVLWSNAEFRIENAPWKMREVEFFNEKEAKNGIFLEEGTKLIEMLFNI